MDYLNKYYIHIFNQYGLRYGQSTSIAIYYILLRKSMKQWTKGNTSEVFSWM